MMSVFSRLLGSDKRKKIEDQLSQIETDIAALESLVDDNKIAIIKDDTINNEAFVKIKMYCEMCHQKFDVLNQELNPKLSRKFGSRIQDYRKRLADTSKKILELQAIVEKYQSLNKDARGRKLDQRKVKETLTTISLILGVSSGTLTLIDKISPVLSVFEKDISTGNGHSAGYSHSSGHSHSSGGGGYIGGGGGGFVGEKHIDHDLHDKGHHHSH